MNIVRGRYSVNNADQVQRLNLRTGGEKDPQSDTASMKMRLSKIDRDNSRDSIHVPKSHKMLFFKRLLKDNNVTEETESKNNTSIQGT